MRVTPVQLDPRAKADLKVYRDLQAQRVIPDLGDFLAQPEALVPREKAAQPVLPDRKDLVDQRALRGQRVQTV